MYRKLIDWSRNNTWSVLSIIVIVFLLIRFPAVDSPLHQDEYKWPMIVSPEWQSDTAIPHPPLSQFIYKTAGKIVGFDNDFRYVPLFFGTINLLLLFYFLKRFYGKKEAIIGSLIWVFSFFSILASLMVDTDGQIMPFFFLIALIAYYHLRQERGKKAGWFALLALSLIAGFFVKASFVISIGAIGAHFLWSQRNKLTRKQYAKYGVYVLGGAGILISLLLLSKLIFPFFNLNQTLSYWKHFIVFDRNWLQTGIQVVKAFFYISPFLVILPFFDLKNVWNKCRVFVFFLLFSFIFYIVLFDFSIGALDRYLQLLILPLTVMASVVLAPIISSSDKNKKKAVFVGVGVALVIFLLQYIPHFVPSLHPKSEWISRVFSLKWNFLYPFSGGSGPLGFYISFLFIALSWFVSMGALVVPYFKLNYKNLIILFILPVGILYNFGFTAEYLFGLQNGSAPKLLSEVVEFIKNNPEIKKVTVYNDNGGAEIQAIGKYRKRLYTDPAFDVSQKIDTLNQYKEHYLEIDVPKIDPNSVYRRYLDSCEVIYNQVDKSISAKVYDCKDAPDIKI
jgi:hypothetical protein